MCPPEAFTSSKSTNIPAPDPESFVPPSKISKEAYDHASSVLHPAILNHSIRTYLYAASIAASENTIYHTDPAKRDLLFVACVFHDIGTTDLYNGHSRFEVEGADAAVQHLTRFGVGEEDRRQVWTAIALHTSRGIVQRMSALSALVRTAIEIDFGRCEAEGIQDVGALRARFERRYERKEIEKVLSDAIVAQAVKNPEKAPGGSWPGGLYESYINNPGWMGVNKAF